MSDDARENRLQSLAERQGLALRKSDEEDPQAAEYGKFRIVNPGDNSVVAGDQPHDYSLSLDDVERWLTNDEATPQASVETSPTEARRPSGGGPDEDDDEPR